MSDAAPYSTIINYFDSILVVYPWGSIDVEDKNGMDEQIYAEYMMENGYWYHGDDCQWLFYDNHLWAKSFFNEYYCQECGIWKETYNLKVNNHVTKWVDRE